MSISYSELVRMYESIKDRINVKPELALILGSGLGDYADQIEDKVVIPYSDIDGFPVSTVSGHKGQFVIGNVAGVPVVCMQGRVHYYEGYDMKTVTMPIRLFKLMGVKKLLLTNAAGGIGDEMNPGTLMLINDHISNFVPSPLIGPNMEEFGTRFPDMSEVYSNTLRDIMKKAAETIGIKMPEGVYIQLTGPNYETPAEIRMCKTLGADAVGMSTVCEAMVARHSDMEVCAVSCITNKACGLSSGPLNHEEVKETADRVKDEFQKLITEFIKNIK